MGRQKAIGKDEGGVIKKGGEMKVLESMRMMGRKVCEGL